MSELPQHIKDRLLALRDALLGAPSLTTEAKDRALLSLAQRLIDRTSEILAANDADMKSLPPDAPKAFRDRLLLTPERLVAMATSLRQVAALDDPVDEVVEQRVLGNGLKVRRMRAPLGVIFLIYESRPNVALESFSLAFKAGNGLILKGGKEARHTAACLYEMITETMGEQGVDARRFWGLPEADRSLVALLLKQKSLIDVVIPRGGDHLIEFVSEQSRIPVIKNDRGMCHVYVDRQADQAMALDIVDNAKTHRPGVCNAMETVLVHQDVAAGFLPALARRVAAKGVEIRGCAETLSCLRGLEGQIPGLQLLPAQPQDWDTEHLDLIMNCKVVVSENEALEHIQRHGSRHSEAIVTASAEVARRFQSRVDAAAVYWNASTRFTDGFELGLGAEIGISTQKLHVRGPVGLRELTSVRWVIEGQGQVRR